MPVVYFFDFDDATVNDHDQILKELNLGGKPPSGQLCHIAYEDGGRLHVVDVWENEADYERFLKDKLLKAFEKHQMTQPRTRKYPVHNTLGLPQPAKRR